MDWVFKIRGAQPQTIAGCDWDVVEKCERRWKLISQGIVSLCSEINWIGILLINWRWFVYTQYIHATFELFNLHVLGFKEKPIFNFHGFTVASRTDTEIETEFTIYHNIMQWHGGRKKATEMIIISFKMGKYYGNCFLINLPQKLPLFWISKINGKCIF